jgi:serine/threonine protein kinase
MARPLEDAVTMLLEGRKKTAKTIAFGPIAARLLACVEAIHERKHVVVDIKIENFMLAFGDERKLSADQIASRIRILDLALVQRWNEIGSHRPNDGAKTLVGTPMYASLNVHNGDTPSRRDDLEALGYVIAELLMKLASGDTAKQLPWSSGKSDEEIGMLKEQQIENAQSQFYKQLGSDEVAEAVSMYLNEVRGYAYKKKPDYEALTQILTGINLPISAPKKSVVNKKRQSTRTTSAARDEPQPASVSTSTTGKRRVTRSQGKENAAEGSPAKVQKGATYMETETMDVESDEEPFQNAQQDTAGLEDPCDDDESYSTAMDWEMTDENQEPQSNDTKPPALEGLTVVVETGPHKGQTVDLIKGAAETFVVGRNPNVKQGEQLLVLSDDDGVDSSHIRMDLCKTKKLMSVKVTDLKSSSGSFVGSEKIRNGKDYTVFRGQSIRIGSSTLSVQKLDPGKSAAATQPATAHKTRTSRSRGSQSAVAPEAPKPEPEAGLPRLKRKGVQVFVAEGPHRGESYELEHGATESLIFGTKPSVKTGDLVCFERDSTMKSTHLKLDLVVQKKMTIVAVTDKSNGSTSVNREKVKKGRAFIHDRIKIGDTVLEIRSLS